MQCFNNVYIARIAFVYGGAPFVHNKKVGRKKWRGSTQLLCLRAPGKHLANTWQTLGKHLATIKSYETIKKRSTNNKNVHAKYKIR